MNDFIIMYLCIIIIALLVILYFVNIKENYYTFSLKCNWKEKTAIQEKPILYYYYDTTICDPSKFFKTTILESSTVKSQLRDKFSSFEIIDLTQFNDSLSESEKKDRFRHLEKVEHTPTIILEYPIIENKEIKQKIKDRGLWSSDDDVTFLYILKDLIEFTPEENESVDILTKKINSFIEKVNQLITLPTTTKV